MQRQEEPRYRKVVLPRLGLEVGEKDDGRILDRTCAVWWKTWKGHLLAFPCFERVERCVDMEFIEKNKFEK